MDAWCQIELFGGFRVRLGGVEHTRFRTQKTALLLAYLAIYAERTHSREWLSELLWAEDGMREARHSLSQALSSLRAQLEPAGVPAGSVLLVQRTGVRVNISSVRTDVGCFTAALRASRREAAAARQVAVLERAVSQYGGELLAGYYEDWIFPERDRLQSDYLQALGQLTDLYAASGDYHRAVDHARRATALDPLYESARRQLMRLYAADGNPDLALQEYEDLARLLKRELEGTPHPATTALVKELRSGMTRHPPNRRPARAAEDDAPSDRKHAEEAYEPLPESQTTSLEVVLPAPRTRLFGRGEDIARVSALLRAGERLVCLTGLGGSGKTRLAIAVADSLVRSGFKQTFTGVFFLSLADASDPAHVLALLRATLRLTAGNVQSLEDLAARLPTTPLLLILDNFEQLAATGAGMITSLLRLAPQVHLLVTSRRALHVAGEQEYPVAPLALPPQGATTALLNQCPAVALFVDRVRAVRPDFRLTDANSTDVAALCESLEGIPLALELAAARIRVFTPREMLLRLTERFDLLHAPRLAIDARHRSLWATIDWSVRLLPRNLRRFFARLSAFRGGFDLASAAAVALEAESEFAADDDPTVADATAQATEYISQLRAHSLIADWELGGHLRFRLLETLRDYAREQLTPEEKLRVSHRHFEHFLTVAEAAEPQFRGAHQAEALLRIEGEHDNLRTALAWSGEHEPASGMARLVQALWRFWYVHGHLAEGRRWAELALQRGDLLDPALRATVLSAAGNLAWAVNEMQIAQAYHEESLALRRLVGEPGAVAGSLSNLGMVASRLERWDEARRYFEESLALRRQAGDVANTASALVNLGALACDLRDYVAAREYLEEGLELLRRLGDAVTMATALYNLGVIAQECRDWPAACRFLDECLAVRLRLEDSRGLSVTLEACGEVLEERNLPAEALRLFAAREAILRRMSGGTEQHSATPSNPYLARCRAAIPDEYAVRLWEEGERLTLRELVELARAALQQCASECSSSNALTTEGAMQL